MINAFEGQTEKLTIEQITIAELIAFDLMERVGSESAIKSCEMVTKLKSLGIPIDDILLRKMINYIRRKKLVKNLIATSSGYYVENDHSKIKKYMDSLTQRATAILAVRDSFHPAF